MNYKSAKYWFRDAVGNSYLLFPLLKGWPPFKNFIVSKTTDICIEGPPRSANSFAVNVFQHWNPECAVARHLHVPMQIIYALKLNIPCVVIVRDPLEVLSSLLIIDPRLSITVAIQSYLNFYKGLNKVKNQVVIATFDEVIDKFQNVIFRVNTRFGSTFHHTPLSKELKESILIKMEENTLRQGQSPLLVPVPKYYKNELKIKVREIIIKHPLFPLAQALYLDWSFKQ